MNRSLFVLAASAFVILVAVSVVSVISPFSSGNESTGMVTEDEIPTGDQVASESQGGPQEGIKVHGEWTIEVFDPDGKLAAHREFKNALLASGADRLVAILGRQNGVGAWRVSFGELLTATTTPSNDLFASGPCLFTDATVTPCHLDEFTDFGNNSFDTLKMRVPTAGTNANKLELTGLATIQRNGKIEWVSTSIGTCSVTSPNCSTSVYVGLTRTILTGGDVLNVTVNQAVVVTVVISFS